MSNASIRQETRHEVPAEQPYGVVTEAGTLRLERVLPGPIQRIWAYLTESDKRGKWLATGEMEPRVGGRVDLHFEHARLTNVAEVVPAKYQGQEVCDFTGRISRWDPPRVLAYTWSESRGGESEVTFELTPRGKDVALAITHRRLADRDEMISVAAGWHAHLGTLIDHLAGRMPKSFWAAHTQLEEEYERRLPE
jgi:uncharacterized protein YndB with AHSA1/START domain